MARASEVTAQDLMQRDVLTLSTETPVREAIATLEENEITGAPVLDRSGRLVGFLSLRDIARSEHVQNERIDAERREHAFTQNLEQMAEDEFVDEDFDKENYSPEVLGGETVGDWMNPEVISVEPGSSLRDVCRVMTNEKIHRVLVVHKGRLNGIVTTFDIVRHLAEK